MVVRVVSRCPIDTDDRKSKLKLGIVGTRNIFKPAHLKPLLEHPEVEIVAVCDTNEQKAAKIAEEHGILHVFSDYRDLLLLEEIDAIDVCTPNLYHSENFIAAIRAGKHMYIDDFGK